MSLATLVSPPRTPVEFQQWAFANMASHRDIIARVQAVKGVYLQELILAPFDPKNPVSLANFLNANQVMHWQMDQVLGIDSNPLGVVDWNDPQSLAGWIFAHYSEHQQANLILGID